MRHPPDNSPAFWMPFTANRQFRSDPRMIVAADGMHYTSDDGRQILDGTSGLWCVNAGHNDPIIRDAIKQQIDTLDYCPNFQFGHPDAFALSERIAGLFPDGLDHVFYTNSGSESADTALKIAINYHRLRGEASRTRLIGRERGYHGVGFGGISVGGIAKNRRGYGPLLPGTDHLRHTHDLSRNAFSRGCPENGVHLAGDLERLIDLHDASTIAAVIVEPMAGSTGVLPPPVGYLQRLREICSRHGIVLIFDEVITAFGRLGAASAAERFGVKPDIITTAKGLTNGVVPMGAVIVDRAIYETAMENESRGIELFHGYTWSANPMAVAAANATLETYRQNALFERAAEISGYFEEAVHDLRGLPHVIDLRNIGMACGIELESRPGAPGARASNALAAAWKRGAMIRTTGDIIALSPPLIISEQQIDELFGIVRAVLKHLD